MFSFFRRSKKDTENGSNKTKTSQTSTNNVGPIVVDQIDMCKNNNIPALETNVNSVLRNTATEIGLHKNVANASTSSEVTTFIEKNDNDISNIPNSSTSMHANNSAPSFAPISYASMLKKSDIHVRDESNHHQREVTNSNRSSVKPCGHGTTAISPRIPNIGAKRETTTSTPPSSPILEPQKPFKINSNQTQDSTKSENVVAKPSNAEVENNTVTASMKLHINIPNNTEVDKKNLVNQEAKFQSQLNDLSKQLSVRDAEANKLRFQMEELQRDVFAKSAGMDRLQAELNAAHKESEIVRNRIRHLENELETYRQANNQINEDLTSKQVAFSNYEYETKNKIDELEGVIKELRSKIKTLEQELATLKEEKEQLEVKHTELLGEREEEKKKVADTLEQAIQQKQVIEKKWKEDFEKMRTINIMKEQQLLDDFEWKLREVQQSCKKRLTEKDKLVEERMQQAYLEAEEKMKEVDEMISQIESLKSYETEVEQLKDVNATQDKVLKDMKEQQIQMRQAEENLKNETKRLRNLVELEKENLQHMQRIHHQEILDKERALQQTLNQKRTEIAMYWEERMMRECGRLKSELEQIHNEEKYLAMEIVRKQKNEEFEKTQSEWEDKIRDCFREISFLKNSLMEKDEFYHEEIVKTQTNTDRDIMELRRLMDKIDMTHHDRYEKLVQEHELEIDQINGDNESKMKELETSWQNQVTSLRATIELVKEQMERESQQKIESLIQQHRSELDQQWGNLITQKSEAIKLVEDQYVTKYKTMEEQFYTQQKSHSSREIELLKTIDCLKNELQSKESTLDDLQNNVDTLEGGIQVLNGEIAQQGHNLHRNRKESDSKIKNLEKTVENLQLQQEKEREAFRLKLMSMQKQTQETIDHLQRKCTCLTKLFEEVRLRYERRESRQEDLNKISDLRQVIAEQEKDLACINEEKRYFQMRLMNLEKQMDITCVSAEEDEFEDAQPMKQIEPIIEEPDDDYPHNYPSTTSNSIFSGGASNNSPIFIPPTIPECDDCDE